MKTLFLIISIALSIVLSTSSLQAIEEDSRSHRVLVSVAPHEFFVKKIAGDTVSIELMVPTGASAHTYEPTPRQVIQASKADIWFQVGEFFEAQASQAMKYHHPQMVFADLRQGLDLITAAEEGGCSSCCRHGNCMDLHIWMSPKMAKIQAETIAHVLTKLYPEFQETYAISLHQFLKELDSLDADIAKMLASAKSKVIMVSHPAYAYFCRDYGLKQISIEFEGKDPTPQQLTRILQEARKSDIGVVFVQKQYSSKGAHLIAHELGAKVVMLDPYSGDYINSMREIARHFASQ